MSPDVAFADLRMIEQSLPLSSRAEVGRRQCVPKSLGRPHGDFPLG
jgi:hypothetical protein